MEDWEQRFRNGVQSGRISSFDLAKMLEALDSLRRYAKALEDHIEQIREAVGNRE